MNKTFIGLFPFATFTPVFLLGMSIAHADVIDNKLEQMELQSPIDIRPDNTTYVPKLPDLKFDFSSKTNLDVINNGSPGDEKTIRANVAPNAGTLTTSGEDWDLVQFHFHTPSEHLQDSKATPLEMHLVFSDASENILVVGRWINYGAINDSLDPIFSHLPQTIDDHLTINSFDLNSLLPTNNMNSFRYTGSLTTTPFSEGVSWINLAEPLYMSADQVHAFQELFPEGDSRPTQPLNGRIILTDVPGFVTAIPEPEIYAMLLAGLALIGGMARRHSAKPDNTSLV